MSEANRLLMMFVKDSYNSANGKPTKKTAIALMKFVANSPSLQCLVNNGNHAAILNYKPETTPEGMQLVSEEAIAYLYDQWPSAYKEFYARLESKDQHENN
jgi:hypothetical protein